MVVVATTKVRIFKQITTLTVRGRRWRKLLLLPQRYEFSSKSQLYSRWIFTTRRCCCYHKGTNFQANHNTCLLLILQKQVVVATTKVRIFKQITTPYEYQKKGVELLLLPQRYEFSSKSQQRPVLVVHEACCCCYHKGTNFQANHNASKHDGVEFELLLLPQRYEFSSKSQHPVLILFVPLCCCCYHKGTNFQANHNRSIIPHVSASVVVATTKVRIFKQITTVSAHGGIVHLLLLLPQRYEFSSKSQLVRVRHCPILGCCCYHKGTNFQANHNKSETTIAPMFVVVATTKVRIFKQITTGVSRSSAQRCCCCYHKGTNFQANHNSVIAYHSDCQLLLLPQRYEFSSKSQHSFMRGRKARRCCCYHKGTNFQANHNGIRGLISDIKVVVATTKVRIFKQITTYKRTWHYYVCCCCYHKGTNFQANHNGFVPRYQEYKVVVATTKVRIFKQITT